VHLVGIDFEDWYLDVEGTGDAATARAAFVRQVDRIIDILHETGARGTFFMLGRTAERYPEVVRLVVDEGHEVASHGYGHERIDRLPRAAFRADLRKSLDVIERVSGHRPVGYRAPYFSFGGESWFYDILADAGIRYSSSVLPARGVHSGRPGHAIVPQVVPGTDLWEIPIAVAEVLGRRIPAAGGGFWRALPWPAISWAAQQTSSRRPFAGYLHPHEFDGLPLQSHRGLKRDLFVNVGRSSVPEKFRRMCTRYGGTRFIDYVESVAAS
jgi:polysaccharide deacetylase family protein (PEP-CTERM system associated)